MKTEITNACLIPNNKEVDCIDPEDTADQYKQ